jgi:hypothetical protein
LRSAASDSSNVPRICLAAIIVASFRHFLLFLLRPLIIQIGP